ncbi:5'-AMP-activated protein kinase beta subunit, interation domain-containing protein [Amylocarpus encephaloides]|uniref:5'-AMP-activated protein kinase beta subunit, interation domain-containing protein n=1 Tax=Amylocarpus encephaloides TaxID=45428 RepID=A0A9P8C3D6_9HELO|nr:5'-AMP-activated protein kinase beta subunit, interation domain-containing protein [Amylocarpus encephaloides]
MGNTPSNLRSPHSPSASPSGSLSPSSHDSTRPPSTRKAIQTQRSAAAPEPSLAQARGTTTTTHRTRPSPSNSAPTPSPRASNQIPSAASPPPSPSQPNSDSQVGRHQSREEPRLDERDLPSKPVDVPLPAANPDTSSLRSYSQSIEPSGPPAQDMSYHLTRPPRLPLPIEEEVHTPGSPIIAPADVDAPALDIESLDQNILPRRASALSNTTVDEEDAEELRVDKTKATVPTTLEWLEGRGGEKVYVTGTIFQWNKKHRLHPVESQPGVFRSFIHVRPGTHHVRFIVDGIMQCSKHLPTTVDFGNNLVNYIEVSADDLPKSVPVTEEAIGAPVVAQNKELKIQPEKPKASGDDKSKAPKAPKTKPVLPDARYSSQVPQYLVDLDKAEDSAAYQYAAAAIEKLPTPPSLPGFLGKPILNAATPMKDDNSVLTMPNHTVLNHLATSSIKNNILAVSATTRYRRKYVTTIMYKPTGDD